MMDLKSFKESIYLWAGSMRTCSYCLQSADLLYVISSHFMYFVFFYVTTSSLFIMDQLASLPSIIHLRYVGE